MKTLCEEGVGEEAWGVWRGDEVEVGACLSDVCEGGDVYEELEGI